MILLQTSCWYAVFADVIYFTSLIPISIPFCSQVIRWFGSCRKLVSDKQTVHELEPKKMGIWLRRMDKTKYRFLVTSGCLLYRNVWGAIRISSFWPKIEVFCQPEWTKGGTTWQWILSIFKFRNEFRNKQLERKK